jgi:multidrug transporter EmrE-like cation transporter
MLLPIAVVVLSTVLYHVAQKSIPTEAPPLLSLLVSYGVAIAGTLALLPFFPVRGPLSRGFRQLNWASAAIGLTIVGVELGFLLAYRAGWRVSVGAAVSNAAVAALLVPVGLVLFGERLSGLNVFGLLLCVAGLLLAMAR